MAGVSLSVVSNPNRGGVPAWTGTPQVRGKNEVDRALTCRVDYNMYTYTPTLDWARPLILWAWKRDGVAIPGATEPVYVTTGADLGAAITCTVTLVGENGTASATTASTIYSYDFNTADPNGTFYTETSYSNVIVANTVTTVINAVSVGAFKTSKTTGSMTAGSPTLATASAVGFTIGDQVIVEIGGEAGGGVWGTKGVGGSFPALSYANATAMNADGTKPSNTLCWLESTGFVYEWTGSAWSALDTVNYFYMARAVPLALVATITNIVGNTITLNKSAVVNTTNANVYYDCEARINAYTNVNNGAPYGGRRVYTPAGTYAFSGTGENFLGNGQKDYYFEGDGKGQTIFLSPGGCRGINVSVSSCQRAIFRKFTVSGNHKLNSWGPQSIGETDRNTTPTHGAKGQICSDVLFDDIEGIDTQNEAVTLSVSRDSWIRNCSASFGAPMRFYYQWVFNAADSVWSGTLNCSVDSDYVMPGCENFGTSTSYQIGFTGRNTYLSVNSCTDFHVYSPDITFNANCVHADQANWSPYGVIINLNTNIANQQGRNNPSAIGVLYNPRVVIEGMMNGGVNGRNFPVVIAPGYANVMFKDGYIEVPAQQSSSWAIFGVGCDGDGATVAGVRFVGFSAATDKAIDLQRGGAGNGRAVACIGEHIEARVSRRNQTNAEYIASGGT